MAYARLDDVFPEHPKVSLLSDRAFRVHVRGICYSAKLLTDGFVPRAIAREWGHKAVLDLVAVGLWETHRDGFLIHDYLDYNPTRAEVEERRETQRTQRSAAGKARAAAAQRAAGRFAGKQPPAPSPPIPSPTGVGFAPDPDIPNAVGNRGEAAPKENGHKPFHLADAVNLHLVVTLKDRYRRRKPWDGVTEGLLTGLVLGGKNSPGYGARAVNAAIEDLYENAAGVSNPSGYLRERAQAHADSQTERV